jgi:protein tyrosine/serine phosphatase
MKISMNHSETGFTHWFQRAKAMLLVAFALLAASPEHAQAQQNLPPGFDRVEKQIYRGGYPNAEQMSELKKMGIKTIVTLQHSAFLGEGDEMQREKQIAAALGIRLIQASIYPIKHPSDTKVRRIVELVSDPRLSPVYVHCKLGDDRTGYIFGAYRVLINRWKGRMAFDEMKAKGFRLFWWKDDFKNFTKRYGIGW